MQNDFLESSCEKVSDISTRIEIINDKLDYIEEEIEKLKKDRNEINKLIYSFKKNFRKLKKNKYEEEDRICEITRKCFNRYFVIKS